MAKSVGLSVKVGADLGGLQKGTRLARGEISKLGRIMRQAESPGEKLQKEINLLNKALDAGEINNRDYGRSLDAMRAKHQSAVMSQADMTRETLNGTKAVTEFGSTLANQLGGGPLGLIAGNLATTQEKMSALTEAMKNGQISAKQFQFAVGAAFVATAAQIGYSIGQIIADSERMEKAFQRRLDVMNGYLENSDKAQVDSQKNALERAKLGGEEELSHLAAAQKRKYYIIKDSIIEQEMELNKLENSRSMFGEFFETSGFKNSITIVEDRIKALRKQERDWFEAMKETEKARGLDFHSQKMKELQEEKARAEEQMAGAERMEQAKAEIGKSIVQMIPDSINSIKSSATGIFGSLSKNAQQMAKTMKDQTEKKQQKTQIQDTLIAGSAQAYKFIANQNQSKEQMILDENEKQSQFLEAIQVATEELARGNFPKIGVVT